MHVCLKGNANFYVGLIVHYRKGRIIRNGTEIKRDYGKKFG